MLQIEFSQFDHFYLNFLWPSPKTIGFLYLWCIYTYILYQLWDLSNKAYCHEKLCLQARITNTVLLLMHMHTYAIVSGKFQHHWNQTLKMNSVIMPKSVYTSSPELKPQMIRWGTKCTGIHSLGCMQFFSKWTACGMRHWTMHEYSVNLLKWLHAKFLGTTYIPNNRSIFKLSSVAFFSIVAYAVSMKKVIAKLTKLTWILDNMYTKYWHQIGNCTVKTSTCNLWNNYLDLFMFILLSEKMA